MIYELGKVRVDARTLTASACGQTLPLGSKVVCALAVLCLHAGDVVARETLMASVWPDGAVDESNLWQMMYVLRKTLAHNGAPNSIENVRGRGYRLTGTVRTPPVHAPDVRSRGRLGALAALAAGLSLLALTGPRLQPSVPLAGEAGRLLRLGRYYFDTQSLAGLQRSEQILTQLVRREPRSAESFAALADTESTLAWAYGPSPSARTALARARAASMEALSLDPNSADAVASHAGAVEAATDRFGGVDDAYDQAITLDPHSARVRRQYAVSLLMRGRLDQAVAQMRAAASIDPTTVGINAWLALAYELKRAPAAAIPFAEEALGLGDDVDDAHARLGLIFLQQGNLSHALAEFETLRSCCPRLAVAYVAEAYAWMGDRRRARAFLRRVHTLSASPPLLWLNIAFAQILLDERSAALRSLRHVPLEDAMSRSLVALDPRMDSVRGDPRFARFVRLQ